MIFQVVTPVLSEWLTLLICNPITWFINAALSWLWQMTGCNPFEFALTNTTFKMCFSNLSENWRVYVGFSWSQCIIAVGFHLIA